jgi:hypothetical protein
MGSMAHSLDLAAELLYARWRRAVDLLWRETVRRRQARLDERERRRSARRMKNLQKIVRRALADYHRIELERREVGAWTRRS